MSGANIRYSTLGLAHGRTHQHSTRLAILARGQFSSLLRKSVNYEQKKFYNVGLRSNHPTVAESLAPEHSSILTFPVPETQFCLLICHILQKIAAAEIRSRNLKTSYELSLGLTQFACDELSVLSKGATRAQCYETSFVRNLHIFVIS
jgi:hypothetical protein